MAPSRGSVLIEGRLHHKPGSGTYWCQLRGWQYYPDLIDFNSVEAKFGFMPCELSTSADGSYTSHLIPAPPGP